MTPWGNVEPGRITPAGFFVALDNASNSMLLITQVYHNGHIVRTMKGSKNKLSAGVEPGAGTLRGRAGKE